MTEDVQTQQVDAGTAWFYHVVSSEESHALPETHDLTLDLSKEWCLTHRPEPVCRCGRYQLAWA
jgi:hypothetical protein